MSNSNKPPFKGHVSHASSVEEHGERMDFGQSPRAGQSAKPYTSGANAHGVHQNRTKGPEPGSGGNAPASQPKKQTY